MIIRHIKIFLLLAALMLIVRDSWAENYVIIAHNDVVQDTLDHSDLKNIYLGKKTRWENDYKVVPVIVTGGKLREQFLKQILKKSDYQFETYWKQMVFTGKGLPPKSFKRYSELIKFVEVTPGAVGFAPATMIPPSVKVIFID